MKRAVIAIVDAAHARLYSYRHTTGEPPLLREERDLVNPGRQAHGMFADTAHRGINGHGAVDDHRSDHVDELDTRFAKAVVAELDRIARDQALAHVIVIAGPRMLGTLRAASAPLKRPELEVAEIAQDLAWLTSSQLHDHLAAMKIIDPRERAQPVRSSARSR